MKKIAGLLIVLVAIVVGVLFTQTSAFKLWFVKEITIENQVLDLSEVEKKEMLGQIINGKAYDYLDVKGKVKKITVNPKIGDSKFYDFYFDLDFNTIQVFDPSKNIYYKIDGPVVESLYMHEELSDVYTYLEPIAYDIFYKDEAIKTKDINTLRYTKADGIWHEIVDEKKIEENYYVVDSSLNMTMGDMPKENGYRIDIYSGDQLLYSEENFKDFYVPEHKGVYNYVISNYYSGPYHSGHYEKYFKVEVKKTPEFSLSATAFEQGQSIVLLAKNVTLEDGLFLDNDYWDALNFRPQGDDFIAVIPSSFYTTPGNYNIKCGTKDESFELSFQVLPRTFEEQRLTVSAETTNKTQTSEANEEFKKYYYAALKQDVYEAEIYDFNGEFVLPATGRVTTEFGVYRYVNGKKTSYRHDGVDIAAPVDTPIVATYDGEIVMARFLISSGNTIVISHGHGIFSTYFHMNDLGVQAGDIIKTGEYIGAMGTTGFSTGSHLHFGISYFNMRLEPGHFIYKEAITYNNYKTLFGN